MPKNGRIAMVGPAIWQVLVFTSERARGNPTGVVFIDAEFSAEKGQAVACALGLPDTAFLFRSHDDDQWVSVTFSPSEPIGFCVQTLLGAAAVMRWSGFAGDQDAVQIVVGGRAMTVEPDDTSCGHLEFLHMPSESLSVETAENLAAELPVRAHDPPLVVDAGRRRLFAFVESRQALDAVVLAPAWVVEFCRSQRLDGVCYFTITGDNTAAIRVFTTSLDGHEDVATGGAVASLWACLRQISPALAAGPREWTVDQGTGRFHRRGTMRLRVLPLGRGIHIGGLVAPIARGHLASAVWA